MFQTASGVTIPFPERIKEEFQVFEKSISFNLSFEKIKPLVDEFIDQLIEPLFFVLEIPLSLDKNYLLRYRLRWLANSNIYVRANKNKKDFSNYNFNCNGIYPGVKKDGSDRHWADHGKIVTEKDIIPEYLEMTGQKEVEKSKFNVANIPKIYPIDRINELENRKR